MEIKIIRENKKQFIDLLLLADEQESMIDRYLERGELFALYDGAVKSICVVTREGDGVFELKNLATDPPCQRQGYGGKLVRHVCEHYSRYGHTMLVGTGDSPLILPFYERLGFAFSHRVKDFFTLHYDHPICDNGVLLEDMVYLKKTLSQARSGT